MGPPKIVNSTAINETINNVVLVAALFSPCILATGIYLAVQFVVCFLLMCEGLLYLTEYLVLQISKCLKYSRILCTHFCHVYYYQHTTGNDMSFLIIMEAMETIANAGISTDVHDRSRYERYQMTAVVPMSMEMV
jgi:hypothetical protein